MTPLPDASTSLLNETFFCNFQLSLELIVRVRRRAANVSWCKFGTLLQGRALSTFAFVQSDDDLETFFMLDFRDDENTGWDDARRWPGFCN